MKNILMSMIIVSALIGQAQEKNFYSFTVETIDGKELSL